MGTDGSSVGGVVGGIVSSLLSSAPIESVGDTVTSRALTIVGLGVSCPPRVVVLLGAIEFKSGLGVGCTVGRFVGSGVGSG